MRLARSVRAFSWMSKVCSGLVVSVRDLRRYMAYLDIGFTSFLFKNIIFCIVCQYFFVFG